MENFNNQSDNLFNISVEDGARDLLLTAATWARIVAIVGFISAGISVIDAFIGQPGANSTAVAGGVLITLIFVAISVALNIFLFRFATNMIASLGNRSQVQFNEGVSNLRTYFKFMGILIIIVLAIMLIVILAFGLGMGLR